MDVGKYFDLQITNSLFDVRTASGFFDGVEAFCKLDGAVQDATKNSTWLGRIIGQFVVEPSFNYAGMREADASLVGTFELVSTKIKTERIGVLIITAAAAFLVLLSVGALPSFSALIMLPLSGIAAYDGFRFASTLAKISNVIDALCIKKREKGLPGLGATTPAERKAWDDKLSEAKLEINNLITMKILGREIPVRA